MNRGSSLNESEIWSKFKDGDQEALQILYNRYYPFLFGYGNKLFPNSKDIDDNIQELFLKLWKKKENLGEVVSVKAYLFKAFRRIAFDHLKSEQKRIHLTHDGELDPILSVEDMLISKEIDDEQKRKLENALGLLTKRQKEIIYLRFYEGLSYEEIESIVQINYQTIRNCVYEAIKVLKKDLLAVSLTIFHGMEVLI